MGFRIAALKGVRWFLWILLGWIVVRGVASFFVPHTEAAPPVTPATVMVPPSTDAPAAFASLFAREYLTWQAGQEADRAARLAPLISRRLDPQAGWAPAAPAALPEQTVQATWPFQVTARGEGKWLVTVMARVTTQSATGPAARTVYLAVPVTAGEGSYAVSDYPTFVPGPPPMAKEESAPTGDTVVDADGQIRALLNGFFRAYASGGESDVTYFLEPGVRVRGLEGAQVFRAIPELNIRKVGSETWAALLVQMDDPVAAVSTRQRFEVEVALRDGRWYIKQIAQKGV